MNSMKEMLERHGIGAYCEVATDPFFVGTGHAAKMTLQTLAESKYELRMPIGPDKSLAVGSFNFHDAFFGERFDIGYADDKPVRTGCVAFGLERLAYAFLCQHGLDPDQWPADMRDA
jgi:seryl-tRNA synthetase